MSTATATPAAPNLGTATLGNLGRAVSDEDAAELLSAAASLGVVEFDSAPHYGLGLAEERLGRHLAGLPRASVRVSSKVGRLLVPATPAADAAGFAVSRPWSRRWDFSERGVLDSLEGSLARLGLDRLDLALLHDPDLSGDPGAVASGLAALARARAEGTVDRIGVATKDLPSLELAVASGGVDALMIPGRLTLVNDRARSLAERCREQGIVILNAAPLNGGGLVSGSTAGGYGTLSPEEARRREIATQVCDRFDVDLLTAALQYAARMPATESIVVGARDSAQLRDTVARLETALPAEFWHELDARLGETT